VAQLFQPLLVDSEVVGELVEDGDPDLVFQLQGVVPERLFERPPVDRDLRRQVRRFLEEPEQIRLTGVLLLHQNRHVVEALSEVGWEGVERAADLLVELPHVSTWATAGGGSPPAGRSALRTGSRRRARRRQRRLRPAAGRSRSRPARAGTETRGRGTR